MLLKLGFTLFDLQQQSSATLQSLPLHEKLTMRKPTVPNTVIFWDALFSSDNQDPVNDSMHPSSAGLGQGIWDGPQDLGEL